MHQGHASGSLGSQNGWIISERKCQGFEENIQVDSEFLVSRQIFRNHFFGKWWFSASSLPRLKICNSKISVNFLPCFWFSCHLFFCFVLFSKFFFICALVCKYLLKKDSNNYRIWYQNNKKQNNEILKQLENTIKRNVVCGTLWESKSNRMTCSSILPAVTSY